jgi:hypothetical protein
MMTGQKAGVDAVAKRVFKQSSLQEEIERIF